MFTRKDGRTDFKIAGHNEKTGLFGVVWNTDAKFVTIYRKETRSGFGFGEWDSVRLGCAVGNEKRIMYKYGKSKIIHWSKNCAKSNTEAEPVEVELLESILSGHSECRNCWSRTKHH